MDGSRNYETSADPFTKSIVMLYCNDNHYECPVRRDEQYLVVDIMDKICDELKQRLRALEPEGLQVQEPILLDGLVFSESLNSLLKGQPSTFSAAVQVPL